MGWVAPIGFLAGLVSTAVLIILLLPVARRVGLLDHPGGRKDHANPTPVIGGLCVALAAVGPAILLAEVTVPRIGLACGVLLLVVVGLLDDLYDIRWIYRLAAQAVAALVMVYVGGVRVEQLGPVFGLSAVSLGILSVPFTVVATVGLINALNMIDGLDGLAGLQSLCALIMLTAAAVYAGNADLAAFLMLIAGAVCGFLLFNLRSPWLPKAKVFLGNSGSAVLGLTIAWASFRLTQNPNHPVTPVLAPFLIALPVIDCLALLLHRSKAHGKPFAADRNHLHHMMCDAGFRPTEVALVLAAASLAIGLTAALARLAQLPPPAFLLAYAVMLASYAWLTARRGRAVNAFRALRHALRLPQPRHPAVAEHAPIIHMPPTPSPAAPLSAPAAARADDRQVARKELVDDGVAV